jgi:hypothetical protein
VTSVRHRIYEEDHLAVCGVSGNYGYRTSSGQAGRVPKRGKEKIFIDILVLCNGGVLCMIVAQHKTKSGRNIYRGKHLFLLQRSFSGGNM